MPAIEPYLPTLAQIAGLAAVLATAAALIALGAAFGGRQRLAEADLMVGWGVTVVAFVALGTATEAPFRPVAWGLLAVAVAVGAWAWRRDGRPTAAGVGQMLVLGAPLLVLAATMAASQWDEFSQWLWSARYLIEVDAFPRPGLAENHASFPAYPYALPLVMYLAARLAGTMVENAGIVFNVCVALTTALLLARLIALGRGRPEARPTVVHGALGLALAMALPPLVVPKIAFTTYAEVGTAAAVAFAAVTGWQAILALGEGQSARVRPLALQMSLALTVLVFLKQANLVLVVVVVGAVAVAGLRAPGVSARALTPVLAAALVLPLAVYVAWRGYVAANLSGQEFQLQPLSAWTFALIPKILATMAGIAARKSGYFGLMLILTGLGVRALVRWRSPFDGLAIIVGGVFLGYNAFLFFSYVAIFGTWEAEHAVSYWRYNMHLGTLGAAALAYGLASVVPRRLPPTMTGLAWVPVALVMAAPVAGVGKLRFDLNPAKAYVGRVADEMRALTPADARLALIDPLDTGFYVRLARYRLHPRRTVMLFHIGSGSADLAARVHATSPDHAWVHTPTDQVRAVFGLPLPSGASYLLRAAPDGWSEIRAWPYPGYRLPTEVPD